MPARKSPRSSADGWNSEECGMWAEATPNMTKALPFKAIRQWDGCVEANSSNQDENYEFEYRIIVADRRSVWPLADPAETRNYYSNG